MNHWVTVVALSSAIPAFSGSLRAPIPSECVQGKPPAASFHWNFYEEANALFQDVHAGAQKVTRYADQLKIFTDDPAATSHVGSSDLSRLKAQVNDLDQIVCRLETIRPAVAPWQQRAIDGIASNAQMLDDNTQAAIRFIDSHRKELWNPTYWQYTDKLSSEGSNLTRFSETAVKYGKVLRDYRRLDTELGAPANAS